MNISYSRLIETTIEHYQQGSIKPLQPKLLDPGHQIKRRADMIFQARLPLNFLHRLASRFYLAHSQLRGI
jgi:hypothetical protein